MSVPGKSFSDVATKSRLSYSNTIKLSKSCPVTDVSANEICLSSSIARISPTDGRRHSGLRLIAETDASVTDDNSPMGV